MVDLPQPNSKISIITPVLDGVRTIEDCILSVAEQSYKNIEHIIVDGRSNDGSVQCIKKLAGKYPHICWISEADSGVYNAMNKGIHLARGEWLFFLGCDDTLLNKEILKTVFIDKYETIKGFDFIYGNVLFGGTDEIYDGAFDCLKLIRRNICHQAIFVRKYVFGTLGYFNERYSVLADYDFNMRCFSDRRIKKKYVDVMVAKYALNGISSRTRDWTFEAEKGKLHKILMANATVREKLQYKALTLQGAGAMNKAQRILLKSLSGIIGCLTGTFCRSPWEQ